MEASLNNQNVPLTGLEIDFVGAYQVATSQNTYAEYVIEVRGHMASYSLSKRYSEIRRLHEKLCRKNLGPNFSFPPFPPKTLFKPTEKEIEKRRIMFSRYFKTLVGHRDMQDDADMKEFFLTRFSIKQKTIREDEEVGLVNKSLEMRRKDKLRSQTWTVSLKPVMNFSKHVQDLQSTVDDEISGFDREFSFIEEKTMNQQMNMDYYSSLLEVNIPKNRYSNILATESTRVKLSVLNGIPETDYINANFINGMAPNTERAYIGTQGPLQSTFEDFWRMIWEYRVRVIVMLTKEVESGRIKCDRYWPESLNYPLKYGAFSVFLSQKTSDNDVVHRSFVLQNTRTMETMEVTQLQFIAWPDFGIPSSTISFLELVELANSKNVPQAPIVVHCSAGIGRTGTFCTVHSIVEKVTHDFNERGIGSTPSCNVVETVLKLRSQRSGMVQTKEQYTFCYLAIQEAIEKLRYDKLSDLLK